MAVVLDRAGEKQSESLERPKEWARLAAAGEAATQAARASLHSQGISVVYQKEGEIVEELPDGTTRPLRHEAASGTTCA